ncbi:HtaA domain-containing protein [Corynebacterium bovis]|nr:HtaA domain-containing protein [Corynebacterium bovis]
MSTSSLLRQLRRSPRTTCVTAGAATVVLLGAATPVTVAAAPQPAAAPAPAACTDPWTAVTGDISWGVKQSFRSYIRGPIAKGAWTTTAPATDTGADRPTGGWTFPLTAAASLAGTPETGALPSGGGVTFTGHGGILRTSLDDLRLNVRDARHADLTALVSSQDVEGNVVPMSGSRVRLADVTFTEDIAGDDEQTGRVVLTADGAAAFAGFYEAGLAMDDLTLHTATAQRCGGRPEAPETLYDPTRPPGTTPPVTPPATPPVGSSPSPFPAPNDDDSLGATTRFLQNLTTVATQTGLLIEAVSALGAKFNPAALTQAVVTGQTPTAELLPGVPKTNPTTGAGTTAPTSPAPAGGGTGGTGAGASTPSGGYAGPTGTTGATTGPAGGTGAGAAGGAAGTAPAAAAGAATSCIAAGQTEIAWGFKQSFRSYITGSIAKGSWEMQGATYDGSQFHWKGTSGTADPGTKTGDIKADGTVRFTGHKGILDLKVSNPEITVNGNQGTLIASVVSNTMEGTPVDYGRVEFGQLTFTSLNLTDSAVNGTANVALTAKGSQAFADFYAPGTELDPITVSATLTGSKTACGTPTAAGGGGTTGGAAATPPATGGAAGTPAAAAAADASGATSGGQSGSGNVTFKNGAGAAPAGASTGTLANTGVSVAQFMGMSAALLAAAGACLFLTSRHPNA